MLKPINLHMVSDKPEKVSSDFELLYSSSNRTPPFKLYRVPRCNLDTLSRETSCAIRCLALHQSVWAAILKLTCWVRGKNLSTLLRKRPQALQVGEPKSTEALRGGLCRRLSLGERPRSTPPQVRPHDIQYHEIP